MAREQCDPETVLGMSRSEELEEKKRLGKLPSRSGNRGELKPHSVSKSYLSACSWGG